MRQKVTAMLLVTMMLATYTGALASVLDSDSSFDPYDYGYGIGEQIAEGFANSIPGMRYTFTLQDTFYWGMGYDDLISGASSLGWKNVMQEEDQFLYFNAQFGELPGSPLSQLIFDYHEYWGLISMRHAVFVHSDNKGVFSDQEDAALYLFDLLTLKYGSSITPWRWSAPDGTAIEVKRSPPEGNWVEVNYECPDIEYKKSNGLWEDSGITKEASDLF